MRFKIELAAAAAPLYHLLDDSDQTLLFGRTVGDRDACIAALKEVIQALASPERHALRTEGGDHFFVVRSGAGVELGRSPGFASRDLVAAASESIARQAEEQREYTITFPPVESEELVATATERAAVRVPPTEVYDLSRASTSGRAGFEPFHGEDGKDYAFHFNDDEGRALLYSRRFRSASRRDQRIRAVIRSAEKATAYDRREESGRFYFILKSANGREIARSRWFERGDRMEASIAYLQGKIPEYRGELDDHRRLVAARRAAAVDNQYDLSLVATSGMAGFETFRAKDGKYYFLFNDRAGRAMMYSQAYSSARSRDNGLRAVIKNAGDEARYRELEDGGRPYFALLAANGQEIARSRNFESASQRAESMAHLRAEAPSYAEAWGVRRRRRAETAAFTLPSDRDRPPVAVVPPPVVPPPAGRTEPPPEERPEPRPAAAVPPIREEPVAGPRPPAPETPEETAETPEEAALPEPPAPVAIPPSREEPVVETRPPAGEPPALPARREPPATRAAPPPGEPRRGGWPWWIWPLLLLLLLLLLFLAVRSCRYRGGEGPPGEAPDRLREIDLRAAEPEDVEPAAEQPADVERSAEEPEQAEPFEEEPAPEPPPAEAPILEEEPAPPVAEAEAAEPPPPAVADLGSLKFTAGSTAARIADHLADPSQPMPPSFTMEGVRFGSQSARLNRDGFGEVDDLAKLFHVHPDLRVEIRGHVDGTETDTFAGSAADGDITLSAVRARCIYRRLIERGVDPARLTFTGLGATEPVASDDTESGRQQNRRIDLVVLKP